MTETVDARFSMSFVIKFLENKNWKSERPVTGREERKRLEPLAEKVYERVSGLYGTISDGNFNDLFSRKARESIPEGAQSDRFQHYKQRKDVLLNKLVIFSCFSRVIELYENSEKSRQNLNASRKVAELLKKQLYNT